MNLHSSMNRLRRFLWLAGFSIALSTRAADSSSPTNSAALAAECQARLRTLGDALQRHLLYNKGKPPARLSDLQSYVLELENFSCPASGRRVTEPGKIDTDSDYAVVTELGAQRPLILLKERADHHDGKAHTFYSDRTFKTGSAVAGLGTTFTGQGSPQITVTNAPPIVTTTNAIPITPPILPATNTPALPVELATTLAHAQELAALGRHGEAVAQFDRVLAPDPRNKLALWGRGLSRVWIGDLKGSVADHDAFLTLDPANAEIRRIRTVTALAAGLDIPGALRTATELLRVQPNSAQVLFLAGEAELASGNSAAAQQHFTRAAAADPQLINGVYQQAGQFLQAGVPQMAYLQFMAVVWASPNFAGGHYGAGMSAAKLGYKPQAIQSLDYYLRLDPSSTFATAARQELERLRRAP